MGEIYGLCRATGIIVGTKKHNADINTARLRGSGTVELLSSGPKRKYLEIILQANGHKVIHSFNKVLLSACYGWEMF